MANFNPQDWDQAFNGQVPVQPSSPPSASPESSAEPELTDYLLDVPKGIVSGTEGFFKSIAKLGDDLGESLGFDLVEDDSYFQTNVKTKTWVGSLTDGITQFAWGFLPALGIAGKVGKLAGIGKFGQGVLAGGIADFVSFQEGEERLSNLIEQYPALQNPITDYLAAKPDDGFAEGRFKNVLEGLGLGLATELLLAPLKGIKRVKEASKTGDKALVQAAEEDAGKTLKSAVEGHLEIANSDRNPDFPEWIKSTKVVDQYGQPLKVYHGTKRTFEEFKNPGEVSQATDGGFFGKGIYFTPQSGFANDYTEWLPGKPRIESNVRQVFLNIQNPFTVVRRSSETVEQSIFKALKEKYGEDVAKAYDAKTLPDISQAKMKEMLDEPLPPLTKEEADNLSAADDDLLDDVTEDDGGILEKAATDPDSNVDPGRIVDGKASRYLTEVLKDKGHDGVIVTWNPGQGIDQARELVVFDASQIRNAIGAPKVDLVPKTFELGNRTAGKSPLTPEQSEAMKFAIATQHANGQEWSEAVVDGAGAFINYNRIDPSVPLKAVDMLEHAKQIVGSTSPTRTNEEVLKSAKAHAKAILGSSDGIDEMVARGVDVSELDTELAAFRIVRNTAAKQASILGERLLVEGDTPEVLKALEAFAPIGLKVQYATDLMQKSVARATQIGNVLTTALDAPHNERAFQAFLDTVKGSNGAVNAKKLALALKDATDPESLSNILRRFEEAGSAGFKKALSLHNEFWINSILSGPKTQATNFLSNAARTFILPAEKLIGGAVAGNGEAMKQGFRLYMGLARSALDVFGIGQFAKSTNEAAGGSALGLAGKALVKESPIIDAATKSDVANFAIKAEGESYLAHAINFMGKAIRLPTRLMTSADELFKQVNARGFIQEQAFRLADEAGLKGDAWVKAVDDHIKNAFGPGGLARNEGMIEYMRTATFSNELQKGTIGKSLQNLVQDHPGLKLVVPFIKTPTNIFRTFVQFTPGVNLLQQEFRRKLTSPDALTRSGAIGQMYLGGMAWTAAVSYAATGRITGGGPKNQEERNLLMATGWRPYSYVVTDEDGKKHYYEYRRYDPMSMVLGLAADFAEVGNRLGDEDREGVVTAMGMALAKNLTSKTYLTGITEVVNALSQPDRFFFKLMQNRVAGYVPNALGQTNDDETMREARGVLDAAVRKLPGYSEQLPPRRNVFGEVVSVPQQWAAWGIPSTYSTSVDSKVKDELASLSYGFGPPLKRLNGVDLTAFKQGNQDAYDRLQALHSEVKIGGKGLMDRLDKLIKSDRYQKLPKPDGNRDDHNPRVQAVQDVFIDYRKAATRQLLKEYPEVKQAIGEVKQRERMRRSTPILDILKR